MLHFHKKFSSSVTAQPREAKAQRSGAQSEESESVAKKKEKERDVRMSYDGKYPINNIISFLFYIITNFSLLNSCCLLL